MDVSLNVPSIPNFRPLGVELEISNTKKGAVAGVVGTKPEDFEASSDTNSNENTRTAKVLLYRSSSPDFIEPSDVRQFRKLGINSIVDLRSVYEYSRPATLFGRPTCSAMLLDQNDFETHRVNFGNILMKYMYVVNESVGTTKLNGTGIATKTSSFSTDADKPRGKHFFINFFSFAFFQEACKQVSILLQTWMIFLMIMQYITNYLFGTWFFYWKFLTCYIKNIANKKSIADTYIDTLVHTPAGICAALKLLTNEENLPALIVCQYGKDRTGLVSALVLSCLGETKENIIKDYTRSEEGLKPIFKHLHEDMINRIGLNEDYLTAKFETMSKVLQFLENNYGSIQDYLVFIGFGLEEQAKLKENILGPQFIENSC